MPEKQDLVPGLGSQGSHERIMSDIRLRSYLRENRLWLFFMAATLPAFIAFSDYSRDIGFFYYFLFSLLMIILVYQYRERYERLPLPSFAEVSVGVAVIAFALWFNLLVARMGTADGFGQTDYVILLMGIYLAFWGYRNLRETYLPLLLIVVARGSIALLNIVEARYFEEVSIWFVETTVSFVHTLGYDSSQIVGQGTNVISYGPHAPPGGESVGIAWGCTGLASLLLFSLILFALVIPQPFSLKKRLLALAGGIAGSFLINLARLTFLILVLYHYGRADMLWIHRHVGDFMFVIWIAIYWWFVFNYLLVEPEEKRKSRAPIENTGTQ